MGFGIVVDSILEAFWSRIPWFRAIVFSCFPHLLIMLFWYKMLLNYREKGSCFDVFVDSLSRYRFAMPFDGLGIDLGSIFGAIGSRNSLFLSFPFFIFQIFCSCTCSLLWHFSEPCLLANFFIQDMCLFLFYGMIAKFRRTALRCDWSFLTFPVESHCCAPTVDT